MAFVYANLGSGPSAGGIGWFDFGPGFTLTPGQTVSLSGTLGNNITVDFDVTLALAGGTARNYSAVAAPIPGAYFGLVGYTGLTGFPILYGSTGTANNLSNLVFSNIVVKDALGNTMPNYTMVVADGENTSSNDGVAQEGLSFLTNGGNWNTVTTLGNTNPPQFVGGGAFVGLIGISPPPNTAYVFSTQSPTQVTVGLSAPLPTDRNGIAIGFAATQVELYKNVNGRRFPADQFELGINGTPSTLATTTGAANGLQSVYATLSAIPGNTYTVNELMAPGSGSALTDYAQTVTAVNITPGGTQPVVGLLPETITPALGDLIQYTITNDPFPVVAKTVSPDFAAPGDTLTYTVTVTNPSTTTAANNVLVSDPAPTGTTYAGGLVVTGSAFTGNNPATGITLTSIPAGGSATVTWNVTVDAGAPVANPISNVATVSGTGYSYTTAPAQTQVNYADISAAGNFVKTATPAGVAPGGTITYSMTLNNSGTVAANNVVITDPVLAGTTFVPGSVTGATGTPPTLTVPTIPAGGSATVTFQVTVNPSTQGPIQNTAAVAYTFTVDPAAPDGRSGSGTSTTASTPVNFADVSMVKTAAPAGVPDGGTITYTLTLQNNGNVPADNVVVTDNVPAGTTFVPCSVTGATGTPPTLTLLAPIPAGGSAVVTVNSGAQSPVSNSATAAFTYTADPTNPDGESGTAASNPTDTAVNNASLTMNKSADKAFVQPGDIITYTVTINNTGNVAANNVVLTDNVPIDTTFVPGSVVGATGTPPTLTLNSPIPAGGTATVTFQVQVNAGNQTPISNVATAGFTFTADPANPNGASGTSTSTTSTTQTSYASVTTDKSVSPEFANVGDVLTYTITLQNSGNASANNVVITDPVPAGTTFVAGSVTGATGTPPTLNVATIPAGGTVVVTYQVKIENGIPSTNPVLNTASTSYTYTVDPSNLNGVSAVSNSNTIGAQVNSASFKFVKTADKTVAYLGDVITYQISMTNTGNVPANNVVITDPIPAGTQLVPGSLIVSVPYTGSPALGIQLTNPVAPGETVTVTFQIKVTDVPNPNPIVNTATAAFTYTVDPANPDGVSGTATSDSFTTAVFRNNFGQQISDLIESVALEEAALAAIAQAEGAKIQKIVSMGGVTPQQLLCLNNSVTEMMDSIAMLEAVLKQKLNVTDCQINGTGGCM